MKEINFSTERNMAAAAGHGGRYISLVKMDVIGYTMLADDWSKFLKDEDSENVYYS